MSSVAALRTTTAAPTASPTTEGYTTTAVTSTTTENAAPTTTPSSAITTEAYTTTTENPTTMPVFSATPATENAAPTTPFSLTTKASATQAVNPTTTQISSETLSTTNKTLTTETINPTTMPVFPAPTTAPPATENVALATTAQFSTNDVSTATAVNLTTMPVFPEPPTNTAPPKTAVTSTTDASTITDVNPTSTPFSSANTSSPITTISAAPTPSSVTKDDTTTTVTPTPLLVFSGPTIAPPATENAVLTSTLPSVSSTSRVSPSTTTISPTTIPLFTKTRTVAATTFVTPTTMPMLSEFTKSFVNTTSSLLNATTNAVTLTSLSETESPAPTAVVSQSTKMVSLATTETTAPIIMTATQETTMSLSMSATAATVASTQTTAVVASKLLFNSSFPVFSESQVLSAINTLLKSRQSQLSESVKVVNFTYEKISETSYAVFFTIYVVNISMPEDPDFRGNTYQQVKDIINNVLNTLLNEPGKTFFEPKSSNFTSSSNQIDGSMDYSFQDGDTIQPVSFLNELRLQTTTTLLPETTAGFSVTPSNLISGSAVVTSKLVFNSSSPVPSEALVLSAINTLRNTRESQLNESVKVVNVSYEKISETSYAMVFTFKLVNISITEDPALRNNTYPQVQDIINKALNTLLNEPGKEVFKPNSFNFTSTSNQIEGRMDYSFQDGDTIQPVSFLNELRLPTTTTVLPQTTNGFSVTPPNLVSGSAVVTSKLVFNSSSPVPSEALVLSAINTLRNTRESQLSESVKVVNVSYEKISETSYAVVFTFQLVNISMPEDPKYRGNTKPQVQDIINNALNTLLNEPGKTFFVPKSSNFTSSSNQIEGSMDYSFQDGDTIQPVSFLKELLLPTTTTLLPETTAGFSVTPSNLISGSAVVTSKLVFNSSSPVPSEALVLSAINTLRNSRESQLNESVKVVNVSYEKISETSYAVVFTFKLVNISMPEDPKYRGNTKPQVQDIINNALNALLNEPGKTFFEPKSSNFTSSSNQIDGNMDYSFQDGDTIQPVSFLNELRLPTTTTLLPETTAGFSVTPSNLISGSAVVTSNMVFNPSSPIPSEALVLSAINTLRNTRESQLNESVKVVNVSYEKISETSYAMVFTFKLVNISITEDPALRNNTYPQVQDIINKALNTLLNEPGKEVFKPNSFNFTSTSNQIDGRMDYSFQDGDTIQPVSFLNELRLPTTTTVLPQTTNGFSVTPSNLVSGSAVVTSKLVFNSSSPVPSEALVLSAINTLRNSRESQLNESVKVVNVSYEKISETSYAVVFTFKLVNISMPEDPKYRGNTKPQVQDIINNALNALLNEPGKTFFEPKSSNFTSSSNQIDGSMDYSFQDGDTIQPVSFLNELRLPTTTTLLPETTAGFSVTPSNLISGSAVVTSKLVFNSSSPVPSEALVLSAINTLRNTRESQLSESVKVVNVSYEKISETSYAVVFTFKLVNISITEDPALRNNTYPQVQDIINKALNTLLNEPGKEVFKPNSFNFTSTSNQIDGRMDYSFQDGDTIQPVSFLNELRLPTTTTLLPQTTTGFSVTSSNVRSGSAVVTSKLVFNSSSPVPSEALVLSAINTLRNSRESQLNESVKLVNVNYEKISESSYAVIFKFNISDISMPRDSEIRDNIYLQVQDTINKALNTLLNEPNSPALKPISSNFRSTLNQIEGSMEHNFQNADVIKPVSFLQTLSSLTVLTTASTLTPSIPSPQTLLGKAYIKILLVFHTLGPVPSKDYILTVANSLLNPRYKTKVDTTPTQSTSLVDIGYEKFNETSYALTFEFEISNISMSEKSELRNETYTSIKKTMNTLLVDILKDPSAPQFDLQNIKFDDNSTVILASVQYVFSQSDLNTNSTFVKELFNAKEVLTTASTLTTSITSPPTLFGKVIIYISLLFKTKGTIPSEGNVVNLANSLLTGMKLRIKRSTTTKDLTELVNFVNVTYTKINDNSFSLNFGFEISNISMSEKLEFRNETYTVIQDYINKFVSTILNRTTTSNFNFNQIVFKGNSTVIEANVQYVFTDSDIGTFGLVSTLLGPTVTAAPTTYYPTVLTTAILNNSTNAAWIVAIIVPCAIVLGLIPCWILLCCLLCGCCGAIRRRWHRRRSYNVQYAPRNSIF
ncbi:mucin-2 [Carassius carassius]|uniref:mucin-2 n=1 Tax=Carassius carassius TaxID=217509 RepID=UPI0028697529|nr:mucin-2 [Carassius carassius]